MIVYHTSSIDVVKILFVDFSHQLRGILYIDRFTLNVSFLYISRKKCIKLTPCKHITLRLRDK